MHSYDLSADLTYPAWMKNSRPPGTSSTSSSSCSSNQRSSTKSSFGTTATSAESFESRASKRLKIMLHQTFSPEGSVFGDSPRPVKGRSLMGSFVKSIPTSSSASRFAACLMDSPSSMPPPGMCQASGYTPPLFGSLRPMRILLSLLIMTTEAIGRFISLKLSGLRDMFLLYHFGFLQPIDAKVWLSYLPYGFWTKNITPFEGLYCRIISWLAM